MKKEFKLISLIGIFTLGSLWFKVPLEYFLELFSANQARIELMAKIVDHLFIFIILLILIVKLGLGSFNGFNRKPFIRNKSVLTVPVFLMVAGLWGNWSTYSHADTQLLLLFAVSVLMTGLVEEFCMRGLILPLFISSQKKKRNSLFLGVLYSSVLFGIIHYLNLLNQANNFWGVTSQVFFAFSIGVIFGALMLRTGNIFIVAISHGFVNFILGNGILEDESFRHIMNDSPQSENMEIISVIATAVIFILITLTGLNMIRRVEKPEIEMELQKLTI